MLGFYSGKHRKTTPIALSGFLAGSENFGSRLGEGLVHGGEQLGCGWATLKDKGAPKCPLNCSAADLSSPIALTGSTPKWSQIPSPLREGLEYSSKV